ncbi:uncharacterized protein [Heterodontus francisci]|uniref:uncharacterized protein n=1 Tax=Heterodontus francisci TaxID=7792 RepID=UPI00355B7E78
MLSAETCPPAAPAAGAVTQPSAERGWVSRACATSPSPLPPTKGSAISGRCRHFPITGLGGAKSRGRGCACAHADFSARLFPVAVGKLLTREGAAHALHPLPPPFGSFRGLSALSDQPPREAQVATPAEREWFPWQWSLMQQNGLRGHFRRRLRAHPIGGGMESHRGQARRPSDVEVKRLGCEVPHSGPPPAQQHDARLAVMLSASVHPRQLGLVQTGHCRPFQDASPQTLHGFCSQGNLSASAKL